MRSSGLSVAGATARVPQPLSALGPLPALPCGTGQALDVILAAAPSPLAPRRAAFIAVIAITARTARRVALATRRPRLPPRARLPLVPEPALPVITWPFGPGSSAPRALLAGG